LNILIKQPHTFLATTFQFPHLTGKTAKIPNLPAARKGKSPGKTPYILQRESISSVPPL